MENNNETVQKETKEFSLQEYANMMVQELHRVKATLPQLEIGHIGGLIEQTKINLSMSRRLFDMLTLEHTNRMNITSVETTKPKLPYLDSIKRKHVDEAH